MSEKTKDVVLPVSGETVPIKRPGPVALHKLLGRVPMLLVASDEGGEGDPVQYIGMAIELIGLCTGMTTEQIDDMEMPDFQLLSTEIMQLVDMQGRAETLAPLSVTPKG